jgi:ParB family transcriptional regulator, chromosome partitioning protein
MARRLAVRNPGAKESQFAAEFEAPELLTLGIVYERDSRFGGGAYSSLLKKLDRFSDRTLLVSLRSREDHAARIEDIDAAVSRIVAALQARGFKSPYLGSYVVARINPVRFHRPKKGETEPPMPIGQARTRMAPAARKFDLASVSAADLALVAAVAAE